MMKNILKMNIYRYYSYLERLEGFFQLLLCNLLELCELLNLLMQKLNIFLQPADFMFCTFKFNLRQKYRNFTLTHKELPNKVCYWVSIYNMYKPVMISELKPASED